MYIVCHDRLVTIIVRKLEQIEYTACVSAGWDYNLLGCTTCGGYRVVVLSGDINFNASDAAEPSGTVGYSNLGASRNIFCDARADRESTVSAFFKRKCDTEQV